MQPTLKVLTIIDTKGDFSQVVLDRETFNAVRGANPTLPFETVRDASNRITRKFTFSNGELWSRLDRTEDKTTSVFVVRAEVAKAALIDGDKSLDFGF